jgi:hypothetical protein
MSDEAQKWRLWLVLVVAYIAAMSGVLSLYLRLVHRLASR